MQAGEVLEAPPLFVRRAAGRDRWGEALLKDAREHGPRVGGDSRDRIL